MARAFHLKPFHQIIIKEWRDYRPKSIDKSNKIGLESMTLSFTILATVVSSSYSNDRKINHRKIENALNGNCVQNNLPSIVNFLRSIVFNVYWNERRCRHTKHTHTILLTKKPTASESCVYDFNLFATRKWRKKSNAKQRDRIRYANDSQFTINWYEYFTSEFFRLAVSND